MSHNRLQSPEVMLLIDTSSREKGSVPRRGQPKAAWTYASMKQQGE